MGLALVIRTTPVGEEIVFIDNRFGQSLALDAIDFTQGIADSFARIQHAVRRSLIAISGTEFDQSKACRFSLRWTEGVSDGE